MSRSRYHLIATWTLVWAPVFAGGLYSAEVRSEAILVRGATIYNVSPAVAPSGQLERGDLLIDNGKIAAIGTGLESPPEAQIIDAAGHSVTLGLFNAATNIGLVEVEAIAATVDAATVLPGMTAAFDISDAINLDSVAIPFNRSRGLLTALVMPRSTSGLFAGSAALVELAPEARVSRRDVGMVVAFGEQSQLLAGGARAAALALLRSHLADARDYRANRQAYLRRQRRDYSLSHRDLEALLPVLEGEQPLLIAVHRKQDIITVIDVAERYNLKLVLSGVEEGWRVADRIAAAGIPVIINPLANLPQSYETLGARLDNAKLLHEAGVKVLLSNYDTANAHLLRLGAGIAVANGLPHNVALAAITSAPADVFAGGGKLLAQGSDADIVIWSGDPLEVTSVVIQVIADGKPLSLASRASRLRDRYYDRWKALPHNQ